MNLYTEINNRVSNGEKMWAILIDPDKTSYKELPKLAALINNSSCDYVLIGGSLINDVEFDQYILFLQQKLSKKIILFPGDNTQISSHADGILLLSLISGRNPDLLIGQHVKSSLRLKKSKLCIMSTGYILIDGGNLSSVQYVSNTLPIPSNNFDIATATALAGEQLGMKFIYLDAGSGANFPVNTQMIQSIKKHVSVPIFTGGGIKNQEQLENSWKAGADIVVIGNAIEKNNSLIQLLNNYSRCN